MRRFLIIISILCLVFVSCDEFKPNSVPDEIMINKSYIGRPDYVVIKYKGEPERTIEIYGPVIDKVYMYKCINFNITDGYVIGFTKKQDSDFIGGSETDLLNCYGNPDETFKVKGLDKVHAYKDVSFMINDSVVIRTKRNK